jgi:uncharacterized protein YjiS (DUF1127 family)
LRRAVAPISRASINAGRHHAHTGTDIRRIRTMSRALPSSRHLAARRDAAGLTAAVAAAFQRYDQWRKSRRAMRHLSNLPDALLHDMGITRNEISSAVLYGRANPTRQPK